LRASQIEKGPAGAAGEAKSREETPKRAVVVAPTTVATIDADVPGPA
jgi:hypothetical protein